jgi:hypothetical protein
MERKEVMMRSMSTATTARQYAEPRAALPATHRALLSSRLILLLVPVALIAVAVFVAIGAGQKPAPTATATVAAPGVNPALILRPRAATLAGTAGTVNLKMMVAPLIPGTNHLVLTLTQHGRPLDGAHISLQITMPGMLMRPIHVEARAGGHGLYQAAAPLSMFGGWRLAVQVTAPHQAPVSHVFALNMDIPASVLKALAAQQGQ